jgi:hypothetical protein
MGDVFTAFGSAEAYHAPIGDIWRPAHGGGPIVNLMGVFPINRIVFRPRPTAPDAIIANYAISYGDATTIDADRQVLFSGKVLIQEVFNAFSPVKDIRLDPPVPMGRVDIVSLDAKGVWVETAETGLFGEGYSSDASYTSEIIDIGTPVPRVRRYK